ncbi:hypothetical protein GPN2_13051 [Streptomyces murinus]
MPIAWLAGPGAHSPRPTDRTGRGRAPGETARRCPCGSRFPHSPDATRPAAAAESQPPPHRARPPRPPRGSTDPAAHGSQVPAPGSRLPAPGSRLRPTPRRGRTLPAGLHRSRVGPHPRLGPARLPDPPAHASRPQPSIVTTPRHSPAVPSPPSPP